MIQIINVKNKPELASLLQEFKQEMELKRMSGKVCLAYGLSQSEHAKKAWKAYDNHLHRCEELKSMIDQLQYT